MTLKLTKITESLTQSRVLLFNVLSSSNELPISFVDNVGLKEIIADAHNAIVRAIISASNANESCTREIGVAADEVRNLLTILQNSKNQKVMESALVRLVATALTLLFELEQKNEPTPSINVSPSQTPSPDESITLLAIDMHEAPARSFFTDLEGRLDKGGLFVASYDLKPVGHSVVLRVRLSPETILDLQGTVIWTREFNHANPEMHPGMGITLHNMGEREYRIIQQHLAYRNVMYFEAC